ncbi:MAG: dienelactone hydrolase family protein [Spongiibacteraceae bacterium]|jgi:carboxymethylenebutenolidase|nr:dienelactone hydrolase family protein [Spongiibacteraceae bacterium]
MSKQITLTAADGHSFTAYVAEPAGQPRGVIVVLQEIFGVNSHIREVTDGYAAEGYLAIAPALFDRYERDYESGYEGADRERSFELMQKASVEDALKDIAATIGHVRATGPVGVVGYCWGGRLTWLSACRLDGVVAAVAYYGGGIGNHLDEQPRCPVMCHFGGKDSMIPSEVHDGIRAKHPEVIVHVYDDADHGFNCDHRATYHADSARLARQRSLEFFSKHLGAG